MKVNGSRIYASKADFASAMGFGACLCIAMLLLGARAFAAELPAPPQSEAQRDLHQASENLGKPLFEDPAGEGTLLGALVGGLLSIGNDDAGVSIGTGAFAGNLAGKYVAVKQEEYSDEVEVIEAMAKDLQTKNQQARRTIEAMEVVVAEHRARLAELRKRRDKNEASAHGLQLEVSLAEQDLKTMKVAVEKAEKHLSTFTRAREIVVSESPTRGLADKPEMKKMDSEIEALRARIRAMNQFISELTNVS